MCIWYLNNLANVAQSLQKKLAAADHIQHLLVLFRVSVCGMKIFIYLEFNEAQRWKINITVVY